MATKAEVKDVTKLLAQMQEMDTLGYLIVISAGIAGLAGQRGPLTTIVQNIGGGTSGGSNSGNITQGTPLSGINNLVAPLNIFWDAQQVYGFISSLWPSSSSSPTPPTAFNNLTPTDKAQVIALVGNAFGNMVEAGLMYTLFKNPDTMKTIFEMGKTAANGAIGLVKGAGPILQALA
jgi:hypothetical protein